MMRVYKDDSMTNAGILKTAKQLIQKLWKYIGFSAEFISAVIQFNIIQIIGNCIAEEEDEENAIL